MPGIGGWAVSRYDDVLSIFRRPQVFSSGVFVSALMGDLNPFPPQAPSIIACDPPDHTRLRKLANRAFTPRRIAGLAARIRAVTHDLLEQVSTAEGFDLVQALAVPLPVIVIAAGHDGADAAGAPAGAGGDTGDPGVDPQCGRGSAAVRWAGAVVLPPNDPGDGGGRCALIVEATTVPLLAGESPASRISPTPAVRSR